MTVVGWIWITHREGGGAVGLGLVQPDRLAVTGIPQPDFFLGELLHGDLQVTELSGRSTRGWWRSGEVKCARWPYQNVLAGQELSAPTEHLITVTQVVMIRARTATCRSGVAAWVETVQNIKQNCNKPTKLARSMWGGETIPFSGLGGALRASA
jgi:hypothetical protein